jgi:two-component system, cell cycle response regulator CpdR
VQPKSPALQARGPVVVIEDDDAIKALIQDILQEEGYRCMVESSANAGLELIERVQPDVLILDIVLGGTASGWRLLDQLGRNRCTAAVSVIVCSADAPALTAHEPDLRQRGVAILAKPFDVRDLLRLVEEAAEQDSANATLHSCRD